MTHATPSPTQHEIRSFRVFMVSVSLAVALCISGGFLGVAIRGRALIEQEMIDRARADFRNIVQTRAWAAHYGGVYVEKRPGMQSNPFLKHPDIKGIDGKIYTLKNPALMTREISERLKQSEGYFFHITSLAPLNPANQPDLKEAAALKDFEHGAQERVWTQSTDGHTFLRYMGPLKVDESCLSCHGDQGYKVGDIRGGISISFDIEQIRGTLWRNFLLLAAFALTTASLLLAFVVFFFRQLVRKLEQAQLQLVTFASQDSLTGLFNRRILLQRAEQECERQRRMGEGLCCLLVDVDHFKMVNDHFGHQVGDEVLRQIAEQASKCLRSYDILGRYGGEEFLAVLPGTDLDTATSIAERLRSAIETSVTIDKHQDKPFQVTVSLGVTHWVLEDTLDLMIHRADQALYQAKAHGRNRVEVVNTNAK